MQLYKFLKMLKNLLAFKSFDSIEDLLFPVYDLLDLAWGAFSYLHKRLFFSVYGGVKIDDGFCSLFGGFLLRKVDIGVVKLWVLDFWVGQVWRSVRVQRAPFVNLVLVSRFYFFWSSVNRRILLLVLHVYFV